MTTTPQRDNATSSGGMGAQRPMQTSGGYSPEGLGARLGSGATMAGIRALQTGRRVTLRSGLTCPMVLHYAVGTALTGP